MLILVISDSGVAGAHDVAVTAGGGSVRIDASVTSDDDLNLSASGTINDEAADGQADIVANTLTLAAGDVPLPEATQQVRGFDARFKEIATLPGHEEPEMQRLLSESDLELTWIYNGGKGPTSLRLNRLMG